MFELYPLGAGEPPKAFKQVSETIKESFRLRLEKALQKKIKKSARRLLEIIYERIRV